MQIGKQFVVSTVDQIQNGQSPEFLQHLLANPAAANLNQKEALEALVQTYPQCSIFHLLLAKAAQNSETAIASKALQSAAVYASNREVLFRLIHQPEKIIAPEQKAVYPFVTAPAATGSAKPDASFTNEKLISNQDEAIITAENPPAETIDASFIDEKPAEDTVVENDLRVEDVNLTFVNEPARELVFLTEEANVQHQPPKEETIHQGPETATASFSGEIDEEVYEEITAIEDISFDVVKTASPEETKPVKPENTIEGRPLLTVQDKAEKDMLSSIASIDYFTFNNKFGQNQTPVAAREQASETDTKAETAIILAKQEGPSVEKEPEKVSKYHDDKMPFTFLWWLDKTRKEYAGTYQPYVQQTNNQKTDELSVGPELHQQYIESIFHSKPAHELAENILPPVVEPPVKRKEDQLIERFIIEEPHIHPPSMDKLDTENKAKKSSEDGDELVTETLAKIYLDQMLYHKALDTYKKLVLKFPEKSLYFAGQIESIEKKIN